MSRDKWSIVWVFSGMALAYFAAYPEDLAASQQVPLALYGVAAVGIVALAAVRICGKGSL